MQSLSPRAQAILALAKITTKEEAAAAIDTLPMYRGLGPVTLAEIREWAGLPSPTPKPKRQAARKTTAQLRCPCCNAKITVSIASL